MAGTTNITYSSNHDGTINFYRDPNHYPDERYLTDPETDVYKAFENIKVGDIVNITGFVYWYNGVNTHITKVVVNG